MKHSIQPLRSMHALLVILVLVLCASTVSAQKRYTFEPSGPVTIRTNGNQGLEYIVITNLTNASLGLNIQTGGDSNFTHGYTHITIGGDTSAAFPVYYSAWGGDTSYGFLRIHDSLYASPDTIALIGIDTGAPLPVWEQVLYRSWAGNYYGGTNDTAIVSVHNHRANEVTISASFASTSAFDAIAPQSQKIAPYSTGYFRYLFRSDLDSIGEAIITLSGAGISDTAQIHGRSQGSRTQCFGIDPSYLAFNVLRDSVETKAVHIVNHSSSTITLDAAFDQAGGGHFEVLTNMPIAIAAYDTATVYVAFTATGASSQYAKLIFDGGTGCGTEDLALAANIIDTNIVVDSTAIGLFGDETRQLDFVGDSNLTTVTYRFYNDQTDTITVTSISLIEGVHFSITDVAPHMPSFKLGQNDLMEVTIQFDGTPGTYTDTLVIVTENGFIALSFPLTAVINSSDVAAKPHAAPQLIVTPNPSTGPVSISIAKAKTATIEVLDIMGTHILRHSGTAASFERANLAAGTYFVRAAGIGEDGKPFVVTQRIVLQ